MALCTGFTGRESGASQLAQIPLDSDAVATSKGKKKKQVEVLRVANLELDLRNPRLPERLLEKSEAKILEYALSDLVLEELASSFLENGFFMSEPLSVLRKPGSDKKYIVLEGNRRLAALRLLLRDRVPKDLVLDLDDKPTAAQKADLQEVPCVVVDDRSDVDAMIGFRHIGGLKMWESEAKARYIHGRINQLVASGEKDPFKELGRQIGSNAQGVRNPYIALAIARWAREECAPSDRPRVGRLVQKSRFGVWQRALNSREIRQHIGFSAGTSYGEIQSSLGRLKKRNLIEVIKDLTPADSGDRPLVRDSRYITDYGRIIGDPRARKVLRDTNDIDIARQWVDEAELPIRIQRVQTQVKGFTEEIEERDSVDEEVLGATRALEKVAKILRRTAEETFEDGSN